jgi:transcriptional regulator with XRE-family HTH domain
MHSLSGLKRVRTLLQFDPKRLADRIGIELNTYYRYERGERRIYLDKGATLAAMLEVPIEALMREPTPEEATILFARGEKRKALLNRAQGDENLAETLATWDDAASTTAPPQPTPASTKPTKPVNPADEYPLEEALADWIDTEDASEEGDDNDPYNP